MSMMSNFKVGIYDYNDDVVEVYIFSLLQWKHALSLEMKGLQHSQGSVYKHLLSVLNAPDSYTIGQMYTHIADSLDSIQTQLEALKTPA